jgi:hypothetical protein
MTSFQRDIRPLFRDVDVEHMNDNGLDLSDYDQVKNNSDEILKRVSSKDDNVRMPLPPDDPWTPQQVALFQQWINDNYPA